MSHAHRSLWRSRLSNAVWRRDYNAVASLLVEGADVNEGDSQRITPLMDALGDKHLTRLLIVEHGADVNAKDGYGFTPLHWAVTKWGSGESVRLLLSYGADVNATDILGRTPARHAYCQTSDNEDAIRALIAHGDDSELHLWSDCLDVVREVDHANADRLDAARSALVALLGGDPYFDEHLATIVLPRYVHRPALQQQPKRQRVK